MTTKIDGVDSALSQSLASGSAVKAGSDPASTRSAPSNGAVAGGSNVRITGAASQLATLERSVQSLPAVNQNRVSEVRSALAQGTYKVSPDAIADGLLRMIGIMNPSAKGSGSSGSASGEGA